VSEGRGPAIDTAELKDVLCYAWLPGRDIARMSESVYHQVRRRRRSLRPPDEYLPSASGAKRAVTT